MTNETPQPQTWHPVMKSVVCGCSDGNHSVDECIAQCETTEIRDAIIADHAAAQKLADAYAQADALGEALEANERRLQGLAGVVDAESLSGEELFTKLGDLLHNALVANHAALTAWRASVKAREAQSVIPLDERRHV